MRIGATMIAVAVAGGLALSSRAAARADDNTKKIALALVGAAHIHTHMLDGQQGATAEPAALHAQA